MTCILNHFSMNKFDNMTQRIASSGLTVIIDTQDDNSYTTKGGNNFFVGTTDGLTVSCLLA